MPPGVRLSAVVARLEREGVLIAAPAADPVLTGATDDSRALRAGELFCAWTGTSIDAHRFVPAAEAAGAAAALVERPRAESALPQVVVHDGRRAAAIAATVVYGDPANGLVLVGVTGTSGKTTTVSLLRHLLGARHPAASIGTLGVVVDNGRPVPGTESLTTPGPVELARRLRELADQGVRAVALEVSSHALEQGRADGVRFDVAVFTNLSRDHLDYHGTVEAYLASKERLARLLRPAGTVVLNAAERAWDALAARSPRVLRFLVERPGAGAAPAAPVDGLPTVRATDVRLGPRGAEFRLEVADQAVPVALPLLGAHNVENALAAAAACIALGFQPSEVAGRLESAPQVVGRLESIALTPCAVLRDYAHKPDALERVLIALRPLVAGRLIVVFGAGGDRDRGKRPLMGKMAEAHADLAIVTSDNPRTEDPEAIIDEIVADMKEGSYVREVDRRRAIAHALELANADDLVLLAGKGHETYQVLGTEKVPFDERDIVQRLLDRGDRRTQA